jgi:hypothetical protein
MTRREKELFAAAIRFASPLAMRGQACQKTMTAVAKQISRYLTFEVSDAEIEAAVAVNMAGKGERTAVRSKSQEKRVRAQKGMDPVPEARYRLIQDHDSHWYVIRTDQVAEFEAFCEDPGYGDWKGYDFSENTVNGPHTVTFPEWKEDL